MVYEVYLWESKDSLLPEIMARVAADDPLEATFAVMRQHSLPWAYFAWVFQGQYDGVGVAEYSEFVLPDREVC